MRVDVFRSDDQTTIQVRLTIQDTDAKEHAFLVRLAAPEPGNITEDDLDVAALLALQELASNASARLKLDQAKFLEQLRRHIGSDAPRGKNPDLNLP